MIAETRLRELLGELRNLLRAEIDKHGTPRTAAVHGFIRHAMQEHPDFKRLALTMVLLAEAFFGAPCARCGRATMIRVDDPTEYECVECSGEVS